MSTFLGTALTSALLSLPLIGVYILFAVGIVVIYRASRVLNLAHGALALVPAYLFYGLGGGHPLFGDLTLTLPGPLAFVVSAALAVWLGWLVRRRVEPRLAGLEQGPRLAATVAAYAAGVLLVPGYVLYSLAGGHPLIHGLTLKVPVPLAALLGVAAGAAMGVLTEALVVRRLRRHGPVAQTVGTVAVYGLAVAVAVKLYGSAPLLPPRLLPVERIAIGTGSLPIAALWLFAVGVIVTAACLALFRFTDLGLAMRAAADNRRAAALMGVDPDRTTAAAWALGGALAGLAGVLAGTYSNIDAYTLGLQVLPAFVGALIGGLEVLSGALIGCAIVALVRAEVPAVGLLPVVGPLALTVGADQLVLMVVAFVMLATRGQRFAAGAIRDAGLGVSAVRRIKPFNQAREHRTALVATVVVAVIAILPLLPFVPYSFTGSAVLAGYYLLVALSVVLLTGWVGQISLAQAELVGIGALMTAMATNRWHMVFPLSLLVGAAAAGLVAAALGAIALRVRGLYLAIATLVFAWMADTFLFHQEALGIVGGSVSTHIPSLGSPNAIPYFNFSDPTSSPKLIYIIVMAVAIWVIYSVANLADSKTGRAFFALRGSEVAAASLGINVTRYKLLAFGASGVIAGIAGSLLMVYQSSVEPDAFNILASLFFLGVAVVGGVESIGGAMLAAIFFAALNWVTTQIQAFAGLLDVVGAGLLLAVLLLYPGGLAAMASALADLAGRGAGVAWRWIRQAAAPALAAFAAWRRRRRELSAAQEALRRAQAGDRRGQAAPEGRPTPLGRLRELLPKRTFVRSGEMADTLRRLRPEPITVHAAEPDGSQADPGAAALAGVEATEPAVLEVARASNGNGNGGNGSRPRLEIRITRPPERARRIDTAAVLAARNVTVRFGGLTAVNDASLEVREGEIVGLIGPNGAGKTTLFNAISGLNSPTAGEVEILYADATRLDVHERAALGVGRTFQQIQLFPQLTVFENLLVATHLRNRSGFVGNAFALPKAVLNEVAMRARVDQVIDFLDLGDLAQRSTGDLPFGNLRIIELARALVTGSELLLLDEPASGLDNTESKRFADLLLYTREKLKLSMLLIEHDIATVTGVSDYMYVLEQGRIIAEGAPGVIQRNQAVIEAYLGQASSEAGEEARAWAGIVEE